MATTTSGNERKVYIEQKAYDLLESCQPQDDGAQIFYLLGREYHLGAQQVFVIRSILEGSVQDTSDITVCADELRSVEQQRSLQYPGLRLIGWALYQAGSGTKVLARHSRSHIQYFRQTSLLILKDPDTAIQQAVYFWDGSRFIKINDPQIYHEQELDLDLSNERTPVELWSDPVNPVSPDLKKGSMLSRAFRDNPASAAPLHILHEDPPSHVSHYTHKETNSRFKERSKGPNQFEGYLHPINEPLPEEKIKKKRFSLSGSGMDTDSHLRTLSMLTSISAIVLMITLVTGAMMFHNVSTLSTIQTNIENLNTRISYMERSEVIIEESSPE